jgi:F0F1-type ATP synthase assembly protein I
MRRGRRDWQTEQRREMAFMLLLLAGVLVGLLAVLIGALVDDFVVGAVVALVLGAVFVPIWWRRFLG